MTTTELSSTFNRVMTNLWIGLSKGIDGLPREIYKLGYEVVCIEHSFRNQAREAVHPDMILSSEPLAHTLCLEFKSGANAEVDQLERDGRIATTDLIREAWVRPAAAAAHDTTVVGFTENRDRLAMGIDAAGFTFPLVGAQPDGLALLLNAFQRTELDEAFTPVLLIDWARVPTEFVRIDGASGDWEVAEAIGPAILSRIIRGEPRFGVDDICHDVSESWVILGSPARDALKKRIRAVIDQAARGPFSEYIRLVNNTVVVTAGRLGDPAKVAAALRSLETAQEAFIDSLRRSGRQLRLFED